MRDAGCCAAMSVEAASEVGSEIGTDGVAGVAGSGWVVAQLWTERETSLKGDRAETPAGDDMVDQRRRGRQEGLTVADRQLARRVEGGKVANIGRCGAVVERWVSRVGDKCWRVGRDTCIPGRAIVEILGEGVVGTELQAMREAVAKIELKSVVVAGTAGDP